MRSDPADLRQWLVAVDQIGELRTVDGAHWNLEIGGISELNYKRKPTPALLFDRIPDYAPGFRLLTGSHSTASRVAISLGLARAMTDAELVEALRGKPAEWEQQAPQFPPRLVSDGPVFENVVASGDVDITRFPAPLWHEHDGGRYLGTGNIVITRDAASDWVNVGTYRGMVQGPNRLTFDFGPGKHGTQHLQSWFDLEERAPVAVSFGHDPLYTMLGGLEVPTGVCEYNYAGAIRGRSMDVVAGPLTGLPIPATSELAFEGFITKGDVEVEGPLGEWTGYYSGTPSERPALAVERVYYRNDPIIIGSPPSKPPHDYSYMRTALKSAMIQDALIKAGLPGVKMVWAPESGGGRLLVVVSIEQRYCGHSRQAGFLASQLQAAAYLNRYVIVVDSDIDPTDLDQVIWAVCTRSDPATDIDIMRKGWASAADPLLHDGQSWYNSRALIDACIPYERMADFPRVAEATPQFLAEIERKWSTLFGGQVRG